MTGWISAGDAFRHVLELEMNPHVAERRILEAIAEQTLPAKGSLRGVAGGDEYFLPTGFYGSIDFERGTIEARKLERASADGVNSYAGGITWVDPEYDAPEHPSLERVQFSRKHLFELWPESGSELPSRTGVPGRPTSKHLVLDELVRCAAQGRLQKTLAEQARCLSRWLKDNHPTEPQMETASLENAIRDVYRAAKNPTK